MSAARCAFSRQFWLHALFYLVVCHHVRVSLGLRVQSRGGQPACTARRGSEMQFPWPPPRVETEKSPPWTPAQLEEFLQMVEKDALGRPRPRRGEPCSHCGSFGMTFLTESLSSCSVASRSYVASISCSISCAVVAFDFNHPAITINCAKSSKSRRSRQDKMQRRLAIWTKTIAVV